MMQEIVAKAEGFAFTRAELLAYFNRVASIDNWKNPVDARVSLPTPRDVVGMREAVIFFTGSVPALDNRRGDSYRVQARGYYLTVGA